MGHIDQCARCERRAAIEIFCARHYDQFLSEWACPACGEMNGGSVNRARTVCASCGHHISGKAA